ncbi:MAG: hypothetical protein DRP56_09775, partial [Planctomycetota bacterium]
DLADKQFRSGSDERWHVPCATCGKWHEIRFSAETVEIEKDADGKFFAPDDYTESARGGWYRCPHCRRRWSEIERARAVAAGRWVARTQTMTAAGDIRGPEPVTRHYTYRVNSLMLHPRFWQVRREVGKFVAAMAEKNAGSLTGLRNYVRNQKAQPWKEVAKTIRPDTLAGRIDAGLHRRCVPTPAKLLVAAGDYHEDSDGNVRIDYEVRAFGMDLVNWVIAAGSAASFDEMAAVLFDPFPWADDAVDAEELAVATVFVDSGFKPDTVYQWCGKYPGWAWPIKGVASGRTPLVLSDLEKVLHQRRDRRKKQAASRYRGQQLVRIDQSVFSEMVTGWVEHSEAATGQTRFYAEIEADTHGAYFTEFAGMHRVQVAKGGKRVWSWQAKTERTAVHFHDTARYAAAAAWFNKAHLMRSVAEAAPLPEAVRRRMQRRRKTKLSEKPRRRI